MIDIEAQLRKHFDERTHDLPDNGPGLDLDLDVVALTTDSGHANSGRRSIVLVAAGALIVAAVGALVILGNRNGDSISSPGSVAVVDAIDDGPGDRDQSALLPVETLPSGPDVSETPVTAAAPAPVDWYRFAPDLDLAWYLDPQAHGNISMFCWRTTAVTEPQCFVDPVGATIVPLVVPAAGGQTVVLAGGDPSDPTLSVTLDDGTVLQAPQDFDDMIGWGAARFEVPPERVITSVGGMAVIPPQTIENYVPPIVLELVGLELSDFTERATAFGFETRVVEEDGQELGLDDDFQRNRINVVVTNGIVTDLLPVG